MRLQIPVLIKTLAKKIARVIDHGILLARDVDGELLWGIKANKICMA